MNNRIKILLSRLASLDECFSSRSSDVADQRRRDDLIRYVTIPLYSRYSFPSSKLDVVGGELRFLSENVLPWLTGHVQDDGDLFRLLDDLQEAILYYQVRSQPRA